MLHGLDAGVVDRTAEISREMQKILVENPPELLSMHSGDNLLNNDIDWNKASQKFSEACIDWDSGRPPNLDGRESQLEFALDSSRRLYVQNELTGKGHIDLSCGDNCYCAGTFHYDRDGYLSSIHLDSGHYCPTADHGKYLIATLFDRFYDLKSSAGQRNAEHFLNNIDIHIYNPKTKIFDVAKAIDILNGRYLEILKQREIEEQQRLEKVERIGTLTSLVDKLLQFNTDEHKRISKQSPKTGKDDHKAKIAAFQTNIEKLGEIVVALRGRDVNEDVLKEQIKQTIMDTQHASSMRTHKNIDAVVSFFKCGSAVLPDSQRNYASFVKKNQALLDKFDEMTIKRDYRL